MTWNLEVPTLTAYNWDLLSVVLDSKINLFLPHTCSHSLPGGKSFKYHLTRFACCTLNCASDWPADISWQTVEDRDLLNTWHSAALFKCKIKRASGGKKETAVLEPPQQNWPGVKMEMDGVQKRMHSFLQPPPSPLIYDHMSPTSITW